MVRYVGNGIDGINWKCKSVAAAHGVKPYRTGIGIVNNKADMPFVNRRFHSVGGDCSWETEGGRNWHEVRRRVEGDE